MNALTFKGTWTEVSGKLKKKFAALTDDDLVLVTGKEDELVGRMEKRLGKTKEVLHKIIAHI